MIENTKMTNEAEKETNMILKGPLGKPIPKAAYDRAKNWLASHTFLHCFAHNTFCRLKKNYVNLDFSHFQEDCSN